MVKLFISYRSLDSAEVDAIVPRLTAIKTIDGTPPYTVWQDKKSILSGQDWWQSIIDAIIDCDVFIYMVSRESVRNSNCRAELSYARKRNRPVIAVVLPGEFDYNPVTGKNDIGYWNNIPDDLGDLRSQFLFYEGASFLPKLQAGIDGFLREPKSWRDMPAHHPRDPRLASDETNNTTALYAEACDYAWRCEFDTAERLFQKLVNMNDPDFSDEAHEWVLLLREYQKLLNFDAFNNTRHRVYPAWERYLEQFPKPFTPLFDPKSFKVRFADVVQKNQPKDWQNFMDGDALIGISPRVLVYLLFDVSETMCGSAIQALNEGVEFIALELRSVPEATEMAHICLITFGDTAQLHTPLTPVTNFRPQPLNCGGSTNMAGALRLLSDQLDRDFRPTLEGQSRGDYKPAVLLFVASEPDDLEAAVEASRVLQNRKPGHGVGTFLAMGCGPDINEHNLKQIAPNVMLMHNANTDNIRPFFKWVSASIAVASKSDSKPADDTDLPSGASVLDLSFE